MKISFYIISMIILFTNLNANMFNDIVNSVINVKKDTVSNSTLSNNEIEFGLKEALNIGIKSAIDTLGKKDGFLKNRKVTIDLPENLKLLQSGFKKIGKDEYLQELIVSMNRSAEKAVPKTVEIFLNTIAKMEFKDAQKILFGADNEATNYFKKNTKNELIKTLTPIIEESINQSKVVNYYNGVKSIYTSSKDTLGISNITNVINEFSSFIPKSLNFTDINIKEYVVSKTIDGIFYMIELKEKEIREKPSMRTTKTLQKVFNQLN